MEQFLSLCFLDKFEYTFSYRDYVLPRILRIVIPCNFHVSVRVRVSAETDNRVYLKSL